MKYFHGAKLVSVIPSIPEEVTAFDPLPNHDYKMKAPDWSEMEVL